MAGSEDDRTAAALAAGWRPHPRYSRENQAVRWQYPELSLRVWAELDGVHLYATLQQLDDRGVVHVESIASATWQPSDVTEAQVVDWGRRALDAWLVGRSDPNGP